MKIAGGFKPAAATSEAALPKVVTKVCCSGLVPQRMRAAGVSALRPCLLVWSASSVGRAPDS